MMHFHGTRVWKGLGSAAVADELQGTGPGGSPLKSGGAWALVFWPLVAEPIEKPHKISIILQSK